MRDISILTKRGLTVEWAGYAWEPQHDPNGAGDADVAVQHYLARGPRGLGEIQGEYAVAVKDERSGRVALARDPIGARPLYYWFRPTGVSWGFHISAAAAAQSSLAPDAEYLIDLISGAFAPGRSPLKGVHAVPPATVLVFDGVREVERHYKPLRNGDQMASRDTGQHAGQLGDILRTAISRRLARSGSPMAELSGGLDSGTVAAIAASILNADGPCRSLQALTYCFGGDRGEEEEAFARLAATHIGCPLRRVTPLGGSMLSHLPMRPPPIPSPLQMGDSVLRAAGPIAVDAGAKFLLTGRGGDELFASFGLRSPLLLDLAQAGRWQDLARAAWLSCAGTGVPLPGALAWAARVRLDRRVRTERCPPPPRWLSRRARSGIEYRERQSTLVPHGVAPSAVLHEMVLRRSILSRSQCVAFQCATCPVLTFPMMDPSVIDFCLRIPMSAHVRDDGDRRAVERALARNLLPGELVERRAKVGPASAMAAELNRLCNWVGEGDLLIEDLGLATRQPFIQAVRAAATGHCDNWRELSAALGAECWLRRLRRDSSELLSGRC